MVGIIKKIDPIKRSRNGGQCFIRIYFEMDDGGWAETDVVPTFRNYKKWKPIIESGIGTKVDGLILIRGRGTRVNADSNVRIYQPNLLQRELTAEEKMEETKRVLIESGAL